MLLTADTSLSSIEASEDMIIRVEVPELGLRKAVRVDYNHDNVESIMAQLQRKIGFDDDWLSERCLFRVDMRSVSNGSDSIQEDQSLWLSDKNVNLCDIRPALVNQEYMELRPLDGFDTSDFEDENTLFTESDIEEVEEEEEVQEIYEVLQGSHDLVDPFNNETSFDTIEVTERLRNNLTINTSDLPVVLVDEDFVLPEPPAPLSPEECAAFAERRRTLIAETKNDDTLVLRIDMPELGQRKAIKVNLDDTVGVVIDSVRKKANLSAEWTDSRKLYRPHVHDYPLKSDLIVRNCLPPFDLHEFLVLRGPLILEEKDLLVVPEENTLARFHTPDNSDIEDIAGIFITPDTELVQERKVVVKEAAPAIRSRQASIVVPRSPGKPNKLKKKGSLRWKNVTKSFNKNKETKPKKTEKKASKSQLKTPGRVFGCSLESMPVNSSFVPHVVDNILSYLETSDLQTEGLFRLSGASSTVKKMKAWLEANADRKVKVWHPSLIDPHSAASCLKCLLRELPDPLLTYDLYGCWMAAQASPKERRLLYYYTLVHSLPERNYHLLKRLLLFFFDLSRFEKSNKMSARNLATVIGPNILSPRDDINSLFSTTFQINVIALELIQHVHDLFLTEKDFYNKFPEYDHQKFTKIVKVLYPYRPRFSAYMENFSLEEMNDTSALFKEIPLEVDQIVFIESILPYDSESEQDSGWWLGQVAGTNEVRRGILPSNYVKLIKEF